jgi:hypothetical protein
MSGFNLQDLMSQAKRQYEVLQRRWRKLSSRVRRAVAV